MLGIILKHSLAEEGASQPEQGLSPLSPKVLCAAPSVG